MTGVLLCGGSSSRMGADKGLLLQGNRQWVQHGAALFEECGLACLLSVADHNAAAYRRTMPGASFVLDTAAVKAGGPLKGILSVHQHLPDEDLLVLAVDMPAMQVAFLQRLQAEAAAASAEAIVYQNGTQVEPLCAVYKASGLARVRRLLDEGGLHRFSMYFILEQLATKVLPITDSPAFRNYNSPGDLAAL